MCLPGILLLDPGGSDWWILSQCGSWWILVCRLVSWILTVDPRIHGGRGGGEVSGHHLLPLLPPLHHHVRLHLCLQASGAWDLNAVFPGQPEPVRFPRWV